jgi:hypothetical protein
MRKLLLHLHSFCTTDLNPQILALALLGGDIAMVVAAGGGNSAMSLKDPNDLFLWLKVRSSRACTQRSTY